MTPMGKATPRQKTYDNPASPMHGWPIGRRMDAFAFPLLEVFCPCDIGHPMPESVMVLERLKPEGSPWGVHACCGCCRRDERP